VIITLATDKKSNNMLRATWELDGEIITAIRGSQYKLKYGFNNPTRRASNPWKKAEYDSGSITYDEAGAAELFEFGNVAQRLLQSAVDEYASGHQTHTAGGLTATAKSGDVSIKFPIMGSYTTKRVYYLDLFKSVEAKDGGYRIQPILPNMDTLHTVLRSGFLTVPTFNLDRIVVKNVPAANIVTYNFCRDLRAVLVKEEAPVSRYIDDYDAEIIAAMASSMGNIDIDDPTVDESDEDEFGDLPQI